MFFFLRPILCFLWFTVNLTTLQMEERPSKGCVTANYQDLWLPARSDQESVTQGELLWLHHELIRRKKNSFGMTYSSVYLKCTLYVLSAGKP